jgi:pectin methylesterase-like acyl-CoA thioesterase
MRIPGRRPAASASSSASRPATTTRWCTCRPETLRSRCAARDRIGTFCTAVLTIERGGTRLQNLSIENTHDEGAGNVDQQAVALAVEGADRVHLDRVRLLGHQDKPGELKPSALAAVGKMVVMRSRLGPHIAADEPWAPWQRDRAHRAYRPAQHDSDEGWRLLSAAGRDPAAHGFTRVQPTRPWLAEHRNRLCADAGRRCVPDPNHAGGLE